MRCFHHPGVHCFVSAEGRWQCRKCNPSYWSSQLKELRRLSQPKKLEQVATLYAPVFFRFSRSIPKKGVYRDRGTRRIRGCVKRKMFVPDWDSQKVSIKKNNKEQKQIEVSSDSLDIDSSIISRSHFFFFYAVHQISLQKNIIRFRLNRSLDLMSLRISVSKIIEENHKKWKEEGSRDEVDLVEKVTTEQLSERIAVEAIKKRIAERNEKDPIPLRKPAAIRAVNSKGKICVGGEGNCWMTLGWFKLSWMQTFFLKLYYCNFMVTLLLYLCGVRERVEKKTLEDVLERAERALEVDIIDGEEVPFEEVLAENATSERFANCQTFMDDKGKLRKRVRLADEMKIEVRSQPDGDLHIVQIHNLFATWNFAQLFKMFVDVPFLGSYLGSEEEKPGIILSVPDFIEYLKDYRATREEEIVVGAQFAVDEEGKLEKVAKKAKSAAKFALEPTSELVTGVAKTAELLADEIVRRSHHVHLPDHLEGAIPLPIPSDDHLEHMPTIIETAQMTLSGGDEISTLPPLIIPTEPIIPSIDITIPAAVQHAAELLGGAGLLAADVMKSFIGGAVDVVPFVMPALRLYAYATAEANRVHNSSKTVSRIIQTQMDDVLKKRDKVIDDVFEKLYEGGACRYVGPDPYLKSASNDYDFDDRMTAHQTLGELAEADISERFRADNRGTRIHLPSSIKDEVCDVLRETFPRFHLRKCQCHHPHGVASVVRNIMMAEWGRQMLAMDLERCVGVGLSPQQVTILPQIVHNCGPRISGRDIMRHESTYGKKASKAFERVSQNHLFQDCKHAAHADLTLAPFSAHDISVVDFVKSMIRNGSRRGWVLLNLPVPFLDPRITTYEDRLNGFIYHKTSGKIKMYFADSASAGYVSDVETTMSWLQPPPRISGYHVMIEERMRFGTTYWLEVTACLGPHEVTPRRHTLGEAFISLPVLKPGWRVEEGNSTFFAVPSRRFRALVTFLATAPDGRATFMVGANKLRGQLAEVRIGNKTIENRLDLTVSQFFSFVAHGLIALRMAQDDIAGVVPKIHGMLDREQQLHSRSFIVRYQRYLRDLVSLRLTKTEKLNEVSLWDRFMDALTMNDLRQQDGFDPYEDANAFFVCEDVGVIESPVVIQDAKKICSYAHHFAMETNRWYNEGVKFSGQVAHKAKQITDKCIKQMETRAKARASNLRARLKREFDETLNYHSKVRRLEAEGKIKVKVPQLFFESEADHSMNWRSRKPKEPVDIRLPPVDEQEEYDLAEERVVEKVVYYHVEGDRALTVDLPEMKYNPGNGSVGMIGSVRKGKSAIDYVEIDEPKAGSSTYKMIFPPDEVYRSFDRPFDPYKPKVKLKTRVVIAGESERKFDQQSAASSAVIDQVEKEGEVTNDVGRDSENAAIGTSNQVSVNVDEEIGELGAADPVMVPDDPEDNDEVITESKKTFVNPHRMLYRSAFFAERFAHPLRDEGVSEKVSNYPADQDIELKLARLRSGRFNEIMPSQRRIEVIDAALRAEDNTLARSGEYDLDDLTMDMPEGMRVRVQNFFRLAKTEEFFEYSYPDLVLTGVPGAGKSSLIAKVLSKRVGVTVVVPTKTLAQQWADANPGFDVIMQHRYPKKKFNYLVIDEVFNLSRETVLAWLGIAHRQGSRVILLGDPYQQVDPENEGFASSEAIMTTRRLDMRISYSVPRDAWRLLIKLHGWDPRIYCTASEVASSIIAGVATRGKVDGDCMELFFQKNSSLKNRNGVISIGQSQGTRADHVVMYIQEKHELKTLAKYRGLFTVLLSRQRTTLNLIFSSFDDMIAGAEFLELKRKRIVNGIGRGITDRHRFPNETDWETYMFTLPDEVVDSAVSGDVLHHAEFVRTLRIDEPEYSVHEPAFVKPPDDYEIQDFINGLTNFDSFKDHDHALDFHINQSKALKSVGEVSDLVAFTNVRSGFESASKLAEIQQGNDRAADLWNIALRQCDTSKKSVALRDAAAGGMKVFKRFLEAYCSDNFETVVGLQDFGEEWIMRRSNAFLKRSLQTVFAEDAMSVSFSAFLKTQVKAKAVPGYAAGQNYGQQVIQNEPAYSYKMAEASSMAFTRFQSILRKGVIADYGYTSAELSRLMAENGFPEAMKKGNMQIDVSRQDSSHTPEIVFAFCLLLQFLGLDPEVADLYFAMRASYFVRSLAPNLYLAQIGFNLPSGDPFTLLANIFQMLCVIACRFKDADRARIVQKGDDALIDFHLRKKHELASAPYIRVVQLKIAYDLPPYHAGRFYDGHRLLTDPVRRTLKHLVRLSSEVPVGELYEGFMQEHTDYSEAEIEYLRLAIPEHYTDYNPEQVDFLIRMAAALRDRQFFFRTQDTRYKKMEVIQSRTDCAAFIARKFLKLKPSVAKKCRGMEADELVAFFKEYYKDVFRIPKHEIFCYTRGGIYVSDDHCYVVQAVPGNVERLLDVFKMRW